MTYYLHRINPHDSAEHADVYFERGHYCITQNKEYPVSAVQMLFVLKDTSEAKMALANNVGKLELVGDFETE